MMMIRGELAPQPRRNSLLLRTNYSDETEKENDDGGGTEGRKMEVQTLYISFGYFLTHDALFNLLTKFSPKSSTVTAVNTLLVFPSSMRHEQLSFPGVLDCFV